MNSRHCQWCRKPVHGRTDKKYCNDFCRNAFHNTHRQRSPLLSRINGILLRNRRILQALAGEGHTGLFHRDALLGQGFRFRYFTHEGQTAGGTWRFCYDYAYRVEAEGWVRTIYCPE